MIIKKNFIFYKILILTVLMFFNCTLFTDKDKSVFEEKDGQNLSSDKEITAFSFSTSPETGKITGTDIAVIIVYGTDETVLVASFITTGVNVKVDGVTQISGITANDFSNPVIYTVTAEDNSTQDYEVTVTDDPYNLNLRDTGPAGGLIFYINPNASTDGWKYLEAAPVDQAKRAWGTYDFTVTGAGGTEIGTGKQNTLDIIEEDVLSNKAADECNSYSIVNGGVTYDDWFLPSNDELDAMYDNLKIHGVGGFADETYWSSSEYDAENAWYQSFLVGNQNYFVKYNLRKVRAVRSF